MYTVYRIGGNASDSGLIFTSPSFEYTDSYGSTEHHKGKDGRVLGIAIKPSMLGQGKKTRQSDVFSRRWGQTKQEFIKEWIDRYISWGNSPKDARKFAYEQAAQEEKNWEKG